MLLYISFPVLLGYSLFDMHVNFGALSVLILNCLVQIEENSRYTNTN